ncbi:MAG: hypothetical protein RIR00_795, partial [Pseudomonadota bacterium]
MSNWRRELAEEFRDLGRALTSPRTWVLLAVLALMALLFYFAVRGALRYDRLAAITSSLNCRILSNDKIVAMTYMALFITLSSLLCIGNLVNYLNDAAKLRFPKETQQTRIR